MKRRRPYPKEFSGRSAGLPPVVAVGRGAVYWEGSARPCGRRRLCEGLVMATPITMPQLGESVTEGMIARWLKAEGDHVEREESLVEIVTDKVNAEMPSPLAGTLVKIIAPEGATIPLGGELAEIEVDGAVPAGVAVPAGTTDAAAPAERDSGAAPWTEPGAAGEAAGGAP